jgi:AcrR family transcriptional regulator
MEEFDGKYLEILSGSLDRFIEFGIRSLSMDDLARSMKISKKTLYQYVQNKEDLIRKVLSLQAQRNDIEFRKLMLPDLNAIEALLMASKLVSEQIKSFNPAMVFDLKKYYPELLEELIQKKKDAVYEYITSNLKAGIRQEIYRTDVNIEVTAAIYLEQLEIMHRSDFLQSKEFSFSYVFDTMFDNHIRGIVNENGLNYYEERIKNYEI